MNQPVGQMVKRQGLVVVGTANRALAQQIERVSYDSCHITQLMVAHFMPYHTGRTLILGGDAIVQKKG